MIEGGDDDDLVEACLRTFYGTGFHGWSLLKQIWPDLAVEGQRVKMKAVITVVRNAKIEKLEKALRPFADAASHSVIQDALSFGTGDTPAAKLWITRGFGSVEIGSEAFQVALRTLAGVHQKDGQ